jgi:hypothetical protein
MPCLAKGFSVEPGRYAHLTRSLGILELRADRRFFPRTSSETDRPTGLPNQPGTPAAATRRPHAVAGEKMVSGNKNCESVMIHWRTHAPRPDETLHRCLQRLRGRLRALRRRVPEGTGSKSDGALHRARHGLRADLPPGGGLHGARQRAGRRHLRSLCRGLRRMRQGMRPAQDGPLPEVRAGVPPLRAGMPAHGVGASRARASGRSWSLGALAKPREARLTRSGRG